MKKTTLSSKAPTAGNRSPGPFSEAALVTPEAGLPSLRQEVRQEIHRENVPRQSQRPAERSNQRRSRLS